MIKLSIVADESVDYRIVVELRKAGLEVYAVCEELPSISDSEVLTIATERNALLITEDKDFGELVFRLKLPHKGILLIRIEEPESKISKVAAAIGEYMEVMQGKFSVINDKRLRIKE